MLIVIFTSIDGLFGHENREPQSNYLEPAVECYVVLKEPVKFERSK